MLIFSAEVCLVLLCKLFEHFLCTFLFICNVCFLARSAGSLLYYQFHVGVLLNDFRKGWCVLIVDENVVINFRYLPYDLSQLLPFYQRVWSVSSFI